MHMYRFLHVGIHIFQMLNCSLPVGKCFIIHDRCMICLSCFYPYIKPCYNFILILMLLSGIEAWLDIKFKVCPKTVCSLFSVKYGDNNCPAVNLKLCLNLKLSFFMKSRIRCILNIFKLLVLLYLRYKYFLKKKKQRK